MTDLLPMVTILTPLTKSRIKFKQLLVSNIQKQLYPLDRLEWIVVGDMEDETRDAFVIGAFPHLKKLGVKCRYVKNDISNNIGDKRNFCCSLATNKLICNMDSDDIYINTYIIELVETLKKTKSSIVGSKYLLIFYPKKGGKLVLIKGASIHEGTMLFKKSHWKKHKFRSGKNAEGKTMVNGQYFNDVDINRLMLCVSHEENTVDKITFIECEEVELSDKNRETLMKELSSIEL